MSKRKIVKVAYKATLDKIFKINEIINQTLRQLVCIVSK
jgi:hypothetical protein